MVCSYLFLEFLGVRIRSVVVKVSHAPSGSARSGLVYHDPRQKVCRREIAVSERVGFVGLGIMGGPMARNLADTGFELTVFNRTSSKAEKLAEGRSARVAYDLGELARDSGRRHHHAARSARGRGGDSRKGWAAGRDAPGNTARGHEHQLAGPRAGAGAEGGAEGYRDARRAGLGGRRGGGEGDALHHGGRKRGGLREGQGPLRGDGRDDRSRGRVRELDRSRRPRTRSLWP